MKTCPFCLAQILRADPTENHGAFHQSCYSKWLCELERELRLELVKAKTA